MEPNNTRLQSFYSFRKNKDSAKCCILRIKKASTNYRSKLSLERWNFVGMRVNFKTLPPSLPGLTQNPFWLPYWINMMRLSLLRCIVSFLATSTCAKKRSDIFSPSQKSSLYIRLDRTILFLQLLTLVQVTGKSHPPQTITPKPVIPPKSTHSSRLFESTQDLILPDEGSYYCDTYFGFI